MPEPQKKHNRYMPGLDGLRAIAVFVVILYHLNVSQTPGGLLGVGVFFVLSGYLITDLLIEEWKQTGNMVFQTFWMRRARRLLPALFSMLVVVIVWVAFWNRPHLTPLRYDLLPALLYISNWWLIFHHVSYFESFGPASPIGHLWSLAVEEQFYLIWPLLLYLTLRLFRRRSHLIGMTLLLLFASAFAMIILYQPGLDPSRVYYGTDTRAFALLMGALLAIVLPSRMISGKVSRKALISIDITGAVGLLIIFYMILNTNQYSVFLYQGGLLLLSFATACTIVGAAQPASYIGILLSRKPLKWLGVRSYGIYLWHYPVIVLTSPSVDTGGFNVGRACLQILLTIGIAALSWRWIEDPIRRGALTKLRAQLRAGKWKRSMRWLITSGTLALTISCVGCLEWPIHDVKVNAKQASIDTHISQSSSLPATEPSTETSLRTVTGSAAQLQSKVPIADSTNASQPLSTINQQVNGTTAGTDNATHTTNQNDTSSKPSSNSNPGSSNQNNTATQTPSAANSDTTASVSLGSSGKQITAIGDSVMIDIQPYLEKLYPGIVVDGKIGRQMYQAPDEVALLQSKHQIGNIVIIELGTNGSFSKSQLLSLLQSLGDGKQFILVNTRVPRPWESVVNETLADVAASFPHTTLVDWYKASANKDSYFYPDGVHLTPDGSAYYASLIKRTIDSIQTAE